jgi:hypothetical protein
VEDASRRVGHRGVGLGVLIAFGVAFGFVEAAVVYYLRLYLGSSDVAPIHYRVLLNLGAITFVRPLHSLLPHGRVTDVEMVREAATIVMLAAVAYLAATAWRRRLGAFLVGFATWDLSYYLFLRIIDHWPASLMTRDVFFLLPVMWIGPVITPVVICTVMLVAGAWLFVGAGTSSRTRAD